MNSLFPRRPSERTRRTQPSAALSGSGFAFCPCYADKLIRGEEEWRGGQGEELNRGKEMGFVFLLCAVKAETAGKNGKIGLSLLLLSSRPQ